MFEMLDHNGPGHFGSSFALGFSEPNFVEKPTHPHQGRGSWRPNPRMIPDEFKEDVAKLHKPLAAILVGKEISWAAQAALGRTWRTAGTPQRRQGRMVPGTWDSGMGRTGSMSRPRLHGNAPPSGSPGGCQLGPGGQPRASPGGPGGPVEGAFGGPV